MKNKKDNKLKSAGSRDSKAKPMPEIDFPIVGLGASAGGLEAFEQFFHHLAPDSGMAFVLVSHLDPGHASMLTEILQRTTTMTVIEAQDQMVLAPNRVYVIPPNRDLAIFHGAIQLSIPERQRGQRMPIDFFLRSLAEDQGERAIGVILSGTGSDGTQGLRAIIGAGGYLSYKIRLRPSMTACPPALYRAAWPLIFCRWKRCRNSWCSTGRTFLKKK